MQMRAEQTPYKRSDIYIPIFPRLERSMKMSETKIYKFLSEIGTSEYQGLCTDQIKALLPLPEA